MDNTANEQLVTPPFNERKSTQVAAQILSLNSEPMEYEKLVKLMYNINREALRRWARPVIYDEAFSLPKGLILSSVLNKVREPHLVSSSYWHDYIKRDGYYVELIKECDDGELSDMEVELISEVFENYRDKDTFYMRAEHHKEFAEYTDPGSIPGASRVKTELVDILQKLGFSDDEIKAIASDIEEETKLMALLDS